MALSDFRTTTAIDRQRLPFHEHAKNGCLEFEDAQPEIVAGLARRVGR